MYPSVREVIWPVAYKKIPCSALFERALVFIT